MNYDACDIVFTNCDPSGGVNVRSGVADLEGLAYISADDISGPSISDMDLSYVNVLRIKRDLSYLNHMGLVFRD